MGLSSDQADLMATAHVFDQPAQVKLSTGKTIDLHGVPLKAVFGINAQRERLRVAFQRYAGFYASIENGEKVWEGKIRLQYHQEAWLEEMENLCLLILSESLFKKRRGFLSWFYKRKAKRVAVNVLNGATVEDWKAILEHFNAHHDISKITAVLFPDEASKEGEDPEKKNQVPTSGPASSLASSQSATQTSTPQTPCSPTTHGPESASSSESTPPNDPMTNQNETPTT